MKALITGITGQDGAYLADLLLSKGYEVHGFSPRRSSPNTWRLEHMGITERDVRMIEGDITCYASVAAVIANGYDEVYNLAAQSFVAASFTAPIATSQINYIGTLNLLDAIRQLSPSTRFYQASTSEMFGMVNVEAQNEDTPFHPRSPYGVAKVAAHWATVNYREAYGLHASCGVLFNHESPLRGIEFVTRKITDGLARIAAGKQSKISLGNMEAKRDWGHASDYVRGMWLMLQQDTPDDYCLATGEAHSVLDFANHALAVMKVRGHFNDMDRIEDFIEHDERFMRPSEVPLLCGDPSKAYRTLGWTREHNFGDLVEHMVINDLRRQGVAP